MDGKCVKLRKFLVNSKHFKYIICAFFLIGTLWQKSNNFGYSAEAHGSQKCYFYGPWYKLIVRAKKYNLFFYHELVLQTYT